MNPVDRYEAIEQRREPEPLIMLRHRGSGALVRLDAAAIVAQYAVSNTRTLLVLDEDTPYEEQLHLALLEDGEVLDHLVIGAPYATGAVRANEGSGASLRFRFENDAPWTLSIHPDGRRGLGGLPSGARRRIGLLEPRYMTLDHKGSA